MYFISQAKNPGKKRSLTAACVSAWWWWYFN